MILSRTNFKIIHTKDNGDLFIIDCLPHYKAQNKKEVEENKKRMDEIIDVYLDKKRKPFWKR